MRNGGTTSNHDRPYLKFVVSDLAGPVTSAKLRLYVTDASVDGGSVHPVANDWTETGITWENAPAIGGSSLASAGPVTAGTWAEIPLPASVFAARDGTYSFALVSSTSNDAWFSSREGGSAPQLVLEAASG